MKLSAFKAFRVGTALLLALSMAIAPTGSAYATGQNTSNGGNIECAEGLTLLAKFEEKNGQYKAESGDDVITLTNVTKEGGDFTVNGDYVVKSVIVKGSTDAKVMPFDSVTSGSFDRTGLKTKSGNTPSISNVKFCGSAVVETQEPVETEEPVVETEEPCVENADAEFTHYFDGKNGTASVTLQGELPLCEPEDVVLVSYEAAGPKFSNSMPQTRFAQDVKTISGDTKSVDLSVAIPPCYFQTDLMFGNTTQEQLLTLEQAYLDDYRILGSDGTLGKRSTGTNAATSHDDYAAYNGGEACEAEEPTEEEPVEEPVDIELDVTLHIMPCVEGETSNDSVVVAHVYINNIPEELKDATFDIVVKGKKSHFVVKDGQATAELTIAPGAYPATTIVATIDEYEYIFTDTLVIEKCEVEEDHTTHPGDVEEDEGHNGHVPATPTTPATPVNDHAGHVHGDSTTGQTGNKDNNDHAGHILPAMIPATGFANVIGLALAILAAAAAYATVLIRQKRANAANSTN